MVKGLIRYHNVYHVNFILQTYDYNSNNVIHSYIILMTACGSHRHGLTWNIRQWWGRPDRRDRRPPGVGSASLAPQRWRALSHFSPAPRATSRCWTPPCTGDTSPSLRGPWASGDLPTLSCRRYGRYCRNRTWCETRTAQSRGRFST